MQPIAVSESRHQLSNHELGSGVNLPDTGHAPTHDDRNVVELDFAHHRPRAYSAAWWA